MEICCIWYSRNKKYQVRNNYALSTQQVRNIGYSCIFFFRAQSAQQVRSKYATSTQNGVIRSTSILFFRFSAYVRPVMCFETFAFNFSSPFLKKTELDNPRDLRFCDTCIGAWMMPTLQYMRCWTHFILQANYFRRTNNVGPQRKQQRSQTIWAFGYVTLYGPLYCYLYGI